MKQKSREPSLFKKLINIYYEQAKRRKAIRVLAKQTWSLDFLAMVLVKAGRLAGEGVQIEIKNGNQSLLFTYNKALQHDTSALDDNIFNHLDDDIAVQQFIRTHSSR